MQRYNPTGGIRDFWEFVRRPVPYRWPIWGMSALCTFGLLFLIIREEVLVPPEPPKVSFISTFAEGRSEAEIVASNIANQKRKERLAAEQAARDEEVKEMYRQLGRATGIIEQEVGGAMGRDHALLERDAELLEQVGSGAHGFPVAGAAHDQADERFGHGGLARKNVMIPAPPT